MLAVVRVADAEHGPPRTELMAAEGAVPAPLTSTPPAPTNKACECVAKIDECLTRLEKMTPWEEKTPGHLKPEWIQSALALHAVTLGAACVRSDLATLCDPEIKEIVDAYTARDCAGLEQAIKKLSALFLILTVNAVSQPAEVFVFPRVGSTVPLISEAEGEARDLHYSVEFKKKLDTAAVADGAALIATARQRLGFEFKAGWAAHGGQPVRSAAKATDAVVRSVGRNSGKGTRHIPSLIGTVILMELRHEKFQLQHKASASSSQHPLAGCLSVDKAKASTILLLVSMIRLWSETLSRCTRPFDLTSAWFTYCISLMFKCWSNRMAGPYAAFVQTCYEEDPIEWGRYIQWVASESMCPWDVDLSPTPDAASQTIETFCDMALAEPTQPGSECAVLLETIKRFHVKVTDMTTTDPIKVLRSVQEQELWSKAVSSLVERFSAVECVGGWTVGQHFAHQCGVLSASLQFLALTPEQRSRVLYRKLYLQARALVPSSDS